MKCCLVLSLAVMLAFACGCRPPSVAAERGQWLDRQVGRACTVEFRRDALGIAGSHAIGPNVDRQSAVPHSEVEVRGTLTGLDGSYLVLRQEKATLWIPQSSVLMVRFDD